MSPASERSNLRVVWGTPNLKLMSEVRVILCLPKLYSWRNFTDTYKTTKFTMKILKMKFRDYFMMFISLAMVAGVILINIYAGGYTL